MIPMGYMLKRTAPLPGVTVPKGVVDICSMSACANEDFGDFIPLWRHNGYGLFNDVPTLEAARIGLGVSADGLRLFYYEAHPEQFHPDDGGWEGFEPDDIGTPTAVVPPTARKLLGYDVVCFDTPREHSPLSCQGLAEEFPVNAQCLRETVDEAFAIARSGVLKDCKPGPYRFIAVYEIARE